MEAQGQPKTIRRASLRKQKGETAVVLPEENEPVFMATNRELENEHYYWRLWMTVKNLMLIHKFSRREWVEFCIAYFRDMAGVQKFQWRDGTPYVLPDWDTVFGDPDCRWLSYYLQECNGLPKMHSHLYSRLRIFDAVIRARWPHIARWIQA